MNSYYDFSMENFLKYMKSLERNKQKRMLFMLEAGMYLYEDFSYQTDFGTYPDYINAGYDKQLRTPFFLHYARFVYSIPEDLLNKPDDQSKKDWEDLKEMLLEELNLKKEIFEYEYKSYIIGLKLKGLRTISKREFVKKSGLSLSKINVIEDCCFLAKMNDVRIYAEKGLEKNLSMIIKFIDKNLKNIN